MRHYEYILFDLDGTLTESHPGIINAVLYALKKNGIEETDREKLPGVIAALEKEGRSKLCPGL